MPKVLIITAFWSPTIHVAVNRVFALAKYMIAAGFEVTVLTLKTNEESSEVSDQIENGIRVIRLDRSHPFRREKFSVGTAFLVHKIKAFKNRILNLFVVDDEPGFYASFLRFKEAIDLKGFDFVLSSYAPLSSHRIALELKRTNPKLKWIADFRDEMSFLPGLSRYVCNQLRIHEVEILKNCDFVTSVSEPILEQFKSFKSSASFIELRNGYDFEVVREPEIQREIFNVAYAGTFHGGMNPNLFLLGFAELVKKYPVQKFQINFFCGMVPIDIPVELRNVVKIHSKVAYSDVPQILKDASLLLLIQAPSKRTGVYSGKTFDYLAINRPIFALVNTNDVAAKLILECQAGYICHQSEELKSADVLQVLDKVYQDWLQKRLPNRDWELINLVSRKEQVSKLVEKMQESLL